MRMWTESSLYIISCTTKIWSLLINLSISLEITISHSQVEGNYYGYYDQNYYNTRDFH